MKTKTAQNNRKGQHKVLNASKPPMNVKNRDQLRKKLKGLLEKQVVSPPKNTGQKISTKSNTFQNTKVGNGSGNKRPNQVNSKSSKQNGKDKTSDNIPQKQKQTVTAKIPKTKSSITNSKNENFKKVVTKSDISKKKENIIKKQSNLNKKEKHLKNGTKTSESPQTSDSNFKNSKSKVDKSQKKPDKSGAKRIFAESKKITQTKKKPKSALNAKSAQSGQFKQGQGPLRPQTSESEIDSSPRPLKRKTKQKIISESEIDSSPTTKNKNPNLEQALVRAENNFEGSCTDNNHVDSSCFDFLFDETYVDDSEQTSSFSGDSQDEYTEEESEFDYSGEESDSEYFSDSSENESANCDYSENEYFDDYLSDDISTDDESYQPPENLPEDVYIAKGTAVKYDISTDDVGFDSEIEHAQIIEMPSKETEQKSTLPERKSLPLTTKQNKISKAANQSNDESSLDSDDSCPTLVPIESIQSDTNDYDSSSCESSHSCCSSCDCGYGDEVVDTDSEQQYTPMTPEVIKAKAEIIDEMETFFDSKINCQKKPSTNSVLEEITSSSNNSLRFKVYTINNEEVLNNDSFSSESSKAGAKKSQKRINTSSSENSSPVPISVSTQKVNELPQNTMTEPAHVNKKAKITHDLPSQNDEPSQFNKKDKTNSANPSLSKTQIRTLFFNAVNCNQVIVLLKDPLYIYGTVKLKHLAGCLQIFGYNPKRNEVLEIFSPRGYSSLKIESSKLGVNVPINEKEILSLAPYFIRSDLEEVLKEFNPSSDAIFLLERNDRSKKVNMIRKYMVEHLFPNMNSIQSDRPFYTSEFLLRCIITPNTDNGLVINPDWNTIRVENNTKIMIIGGKSVGKSTLARYMINKSLNKHQKILLVDLDIGQPELFVPQTISATTLTAPLLGPGYFLNKQPDKSFLVGHFNIIHSLEPYIESLKALIEYCNGNSEYKDIPWVVNTMGYNKGFGDELISVICSLLQPTNIIQFESDREINDFDVIMFKENVKSIERNIVGDIFKPLKEIIPQHQLTLIKSLIPRTRSNKNESTMKPRDMRLAMILSRLSNILIGHAEWLTDVKPFCASIDDLNIIKMGDDQIDKEDLVKTLVGNLVYLCRFESGTAHECFGIGIVRGVDYPLRQIYLLPTIPIDVLKNVNCLAICGIPLPSSILLKQGPKVKGTASFVYNTLDESASMYIQQMYNKPQQFPTGKRKSFFK
ncbi:polynucleotide 5'-hydroxyl-kinase NOL9 [Eupeodes corollae]|uniref:polynucleotide 5'-hydroxyl-kinase NOL9 n=1 Tax=Eupeodes corollae TaxID=290404 RepID=UPI002490E2CB|nr:polynucleotide 5'-hydroxyl-kinase NOL9 [Eupeodes corollae]